MLFCPANPMCDSCYALIYDLNKMCYVCFSSYEECPVFVCDRVFALKFIRAYCSYHNVSFKRALKDFYYYKYDIYNLKELYI